MVCLGNMCVDTLHEGDNVVDDRNNRHDTVCAELHCNICKEMGVKLYNEHWYDHVPKLVETGHEGKVTVL